MKKALLLLLFAASSFGLAAHADAGPEFWFKDGLA
jgi:hypothetical protein